MKKTVKASFVYSCMKLTAFREVKTFFLSFPRRRESSLSEVFWTPASAGVTTGWSFCEAKKVSFAIKLAVPAVSG
jgi:hypothetical protein